MFISFKTNPPAETSGVFRLAAWRLLNGGATPDAGSFTRVRTAPAGSKGRNPAFDVTPAALIAGIITERGIVPATVEGIRSVARK